MAIIRKRFLIKPKLQLKYMFITVGIVAMSAIVVYIVLHAVLRSSSGMENLTQGEWMALNNAMNRSLYWIVGFIAAVLAVESVFFFHRMVGPLYVFEKVLRALKAGDLTQSLHLRKGDEFKDVASEFNEMLEVLSSKISEMKISARNISQRADALPPDVTSEIKKIADNLDYFKTS